MACEGFEKRLIERAVTDADPELTEHLANCVDCREELAAQRELQQRISHGIAAMVADEPSPALLTRVRALVAQESAPRSMRWIQWAAAGLAVSACAAVAMWMIGRPSSRLNTTENLSYQSAKNAQKSSTPAPVQTASTQSAQSKSIVAPEHHSAKRASHSDLPAIAPVIVKAAQPVITAAANNQSTEVIVPAGQRDAVLRLVNALRTGRVDAASLIRTSQPVDVAPLAIAPLEVKPINGGGSDDGSGNEFDYEF
jgi:cytoskeletal protein RodZ